MKALIIDNTVIQLERNTFPVAEALTWMDAPEGCAVGWILIDGQLQPKPEPQKTQAQLIEEYKQAMQNHVDSKAADKDYKNGFACASYANSTVQAWKQEATDFIAWRDSCWLYAIDIQMKVQSGEIKPPTLEDFIANAPKIAWPA